MRCIKMFLSVCKNGEFIFRGIIPGQLIVLFPDLNFISIASLVSAGVFIQLIIAEF